MYSIEIKVCTNTTINAIKQSLPLITVLGPGKRLKLNFQIFRHKNTKRHCKSKTIKWFINPFHKNYKINSCIYKRFYLIFERVLSIKMSNKWLTFDKYCTISLIHYVQESTSSKRNWQRDSGKSNAVQFYIESSATRAFQVSWELYLSLCLQRWLKASLDIVINLTP